MTMWEYKLAWLLEPCAEEPTLNKLGAERWELVAYDFDDDMGIFKRPVEPEPPGLLIVNGAAGIDFTQLSDEIMEALTEFSKREGELEVQAREQGCNCPKCRGENVKGHEL